MEINYKLLFLICVLIIFLIILIIIDSKKIRIYGCWRAEPQLEKELEVKSMFIYISNKEIETYITYPGNKEVVYDKYKIKEHIGDKYYLDSLDTENALLPNKVTIKYNKTGPLISISDKHKSYGTYFKDSMMTFMFNNEN